MKKGFPIRLSIAALSVTFSLFGGSIYLLREAHSQIKKIELVEFPLLQDVASSSRLLSKPVIN